MMIYGRIFSILFFITIVAAPTLLFAVPQTFQELPLDAPSGKISANVEWDDVGFIGRIRMKIYAFNGDPMLTVEMPQINPAPANLIWIDEEWVACESFLGDRGSAFFYVHVPTARGYMVEIIAPEQEDDWLINFATNDDTSSSPIHSLTRARSSDFPILMRQLPIDGLDYFSTGFALLLRDGIDAYSDWRRQTGFKHMEFLSDADETTSLGRVVAATLDAKAHVIYFPSGTTNTREMLAKTIARPLPQEVATALTNVSGAQVEVNWKGDDGTYEILIVPPDEESSGTVIHSGRFDEVSDSPYTGPTVEQALRGGPEDKPLRVEISKSSEKSNTKIRAAKTNTKTSTAKKSTSSKKSSGSSSNKSKKPSRSR